MNVTPAERKKILMERFKEKRMKKGYSDIPKISSLKISINNKFLEWYRTMNGRNSN